MGELTKTEDDDVNCDDDVCAIPNQFPSSSIWQKTRSVLACFGRGKAHKWNDGKICRMAPATIRPPTPKLTKRLQKDND